MILSRVKISSILIVVFLITSYLFAQKSKLFKTADFAVFDRQSRYLAAQLDVDNDIVVIAIDDHSLKQMNAVAGRWVWPRTVHGQVIEALQSVAVSVVGFDILFAEQDIYPCEDELYRRRFRQKLNRALPYKQTQKDSAD